MIFSSESIEAIVQGLKTQTRRVVKPGETGISYSEFDTAGRQFESVTIRGRIKWMAGRDYAVSFGRGKPGVWIDKSGKWFEPGVINLYDLAGVVYQPLRIRITAIRRERVTAISEEDILAEGFIPLRHDGKNCRVHDWYAGLWDQINTRKGTRWADSPDVWVLTFEVAK